MRTIVAAVLLCLVAGTATAAVEGEEPEEPGGSAAGTGSAGGEAQATPPEPIDRLDEPRKGGANVTESLQGQDGVRIQTMCTHCNSANIQVGGLAEDLVPISRNEYPLFGGLATSVVLSVLPRDQVADAQISKGPGEVASPAPAAGGVIRLTEPTARELPRVDAEVDAGSFGLLGGYVRASGGLTDRIDFTVLGGTAEADPVDADDDGWTDVGALDRNYAEGRLAWEVARAHTLDFGVSWIEEDTTEARGAFDVVRSLFAGPSPAPSWTREDTFVERTEARLGWAWTMDGGRTLDVRGLQAGRDQTVRSQVTSDPDSFFGPEATELFERFLIEERHRWGQATYEQPVGFDWRLRFGVTAHEQRVEAQTLEALDFLGGRTPEPEIGTDFLKTWSAFGEATWTVTPKWSLEAGARYEDVSWGALDLDRSSEETQVSPRASLRWKPAPQWNLRVLAGRTIRPPKPILSEVCCGQTYQRSFRARAESGTTYGFEGTYQPGPNLRASLYAARTSFDDHILRIVGWSQVYIQTYVLANVPEATADTLELALRYKPHRRWTIDGSIGWLSFFNDGDPDVPVAVTPPSREEPITVVVPMRRIPYRPERTGSLGLSWNPWRSLTFAASANYTGVMLIQQYADDPTSAQNILLPELRETSAFWLVGLSATVPLHHSVDLVASVDNLAEEVQSDLGDPTTDYNWGPLTGRAWRFALRWHLDR